MAEPELTSGHCHRCGGYGQGEYAGAINAWADAITDHIGCPESAKPNLPPADRQDRVSDLDRPVSGVVADALDQPSRNTQPR
ncbi:MULTISPECIES: hypothetical protein [unclassified Kitasatospora]|uniref:hypothetical protein n=1 Tax=unclassified Kitasatospora TaxID=2633591 RepID=UPI00070D25A4|nr:MULTISPECIES: hypothetical protein [unclassified Kitasatospora]KQV05626.1 hypothetical protein ASC99_12545 [Kitasatospora sp. Root107]KRB62430.1 hypothetical protein ASE03_07500 [Kitasatospora sp. Root187]